MITKTTKKGIATLTGNDNGRTKLGNVIWWTIESNLNLPGEKAVATYKALGVPDNLLPDPLEPDVAFARAHRKASQKLSGWLVRKLNLAPDRIVYGIIKETIDQAAEDAAYAKEDKITLNRYTNDVTLEHGLEQAKMIKKLYKDTVGHVDNWRFIDFLLKHIKDMNSIQLRDQGGIYFIPNLYEDNLRILERGMADLTPASTLYMLPIYQDKQAQTSLKTAFHEDFKRELESTTQELQTRINTEGTRATTFYTRLQEYKTLRERAKAYEELLHFKAKDIHTMIDKLEVDVKEALANTPL